MTSVLNRLPRLSGNNLLIILLIVFGISSCASKKITSTKQVEIVAIQKNSQKETAAINTSKRYEDSVAKKATIFDLDNNYNKENINTSKTETYTKTSPPINNDPNRIHNVVVILPFFIDQIPLGQYVDDSTKQLNTDSKNAIEFYLGCLMAKDQFESEHLKSNVYFLDDKNDMDITSSLFNTKPFPNVDYIVGPLYTKNVQAAATMAKNMQIPLISPISNSMYVQNNPYYFNAIASLKTQYDYIIKQIHHITPNKTLEIIYDASDSTAENINILKPIAEKYYSYPSIQYHPLSTTDNIASSLKQTDTISERTILIYSSKDSYIKNIISKLKPIKNHLHIFTSANEKNAKAFADLKSPHSIYTVYPYNISNPNYTVFADKYLDKFKKKPSEIACQGYDLMMHLFYILDKNQAIADNNYSFSADFFNTQTKFQFQPILDKNGNIDYFDNTTLYLYKLVNGNFVIETH